MSALGFEQKVEGLQNYAQHLIGVDPQNPDHTDVANPDLFYGSGGVVGSHIRNAWKCVLGEIGNYGSREYYDRGLETTDLREDTEELRLKRADLLAVMTGPVTPEIRKERTERISVVLADIVSGQTLSLVEFDTFHGWYERPVEVSADPERPLFSVFRNSHISSRDLTIQYEPRSPSYPYTRDPVEKAMTFDISKLFDSPNPISIEPAEAQVG